MVVGDVLKAAHVTQLLWQALGGRGGADEGHCGAAGRKLSKTAQQLPGVVAGPRCNNYVPRLRQQGAISSNDSISKECLAARVQLISCILQLATS